MEASLALRPDKTNLQAGASAEADGSFPEFQVDDTEYPIFAEAPYLSTAGNQIVTAGGQPVRLKMCSWYGAELPERVPQGLWKLSYGAILRQIKRWGFNCVRLPYSAGLRSSRAVGPVDHQANPDLAGLTGLEVLDRIIAGCAELGLWVVLDLHRIDPNRGQDGLPVTPDFPLSALVENWEFYARRYAGQPAVIGADLFCEPAHDSITWSVWRPIAEALGNAIHAIAPGWLILVEGCHGGYGYWAGGNLTSVGRDPVRLRQPGKVVYSPHEYGQGGNVDMPWLQYPHRRVAGWPHNLFPHFRDSWGYIFEQGIAPVCVGEFGGRFGLDDLTGAPTAANGAEEIQWLQALVAYMNGDFNGDGTTDLRPGELGLSWGYWNWSCYSDGTGGLVLQDLVTPQAAKLALLRPLLEG